MRFAPLALAIVCVLTLFVGLDSVGYLEAREARDARVGAELIADTEFLTPVFGHQPLFEKPVLGYLIEVAARAGGGSSPLPSRWLRALIACALVLLAWRLGAAHFGARAGLAGGVVLVTTLALPFAARCDGTQLLATLLAWIAVADFSGIVFAERPPGVMRVLRAHCALAAVLLVAGPLPALWPIGGAALYARLARRGLAWRSLHPGAGLAILVGIGLPWYGAMLERWGAPFAVRVPWMPYAIGVSGPWYAGPVLAVSFLVVGGFPWSALLPAAFAHAAMRWRDVSRLRRASGLPTSPLTADDLVALAREEREEHAAHFFIAMLVAALAPVACYPGPPLTAGLAALRLSSVFARATFMLGVTGTAVAVAVSIAGARVATLFPALRWVAPFALLSGWAPFLAHLMRRPRLAAALLALPVVAGAPLVSWRLLPELEDFISTRSVAAAMNQAAPPRAPLVLLEPAPATLWLYLDHNPVVVASVRPALSELRAADGNTYLAFRPARERETARAAATPLEILARSPAMVLARVRVEPDPARKR
jgi:4-amino-4-deoxy-L-arabinose transferase-like glycosyltransferase